ncbi:MAG TPA: MFS transporter [Streptosporangiaceae bacterium]|nr:MFS transporter [Streptosporangiaceae bacterium]
MSDSGGSGGGGSRDGSGDADPRPEQSARRPRIRQLAASLGPDVALLRRSREFRLLYTGQMWSFAGTSISLVAMPYQAYRLTHSSLVVGLLSFAELVPLIATALLGGALADAVDRRRLIRLSQLFVCGSGAALALNAALWHQLWPLFLLAVLSTGLYGLQRPSLEALVPVLIGRDELHTAASLTGLLGNAVSLAGPLLGGFAIELGGLPLAYAADSAACMIALVTYTRLRATPPPPDAARPSLRGVLDGLRYARSRPELLGTYLIDISAMLFGAPYALFPAIAARLGGPTVLGLLYAAPAAGGLIVSMTSGWARHVSRHGRAIVLAVCGWGAGIAAFGFATSLWWAVAALAGAGAADMVSGIFRMTMWNQTIPASLRGRLAGLEMISYMTGEPVGNAEAGLVAAATGSVRIAVVSGGVLSVAGAAVVVAALPMLWRFDARDHPGGAGPVPGEDPAAVSAGP